MKKFTVKVKSKEELLELFKEKGYVEDGDGYDGFVKDEHVNFVRPMFIFCDKTIVVEPAEGCQEVYDFFGGERDKWFWIKDWLDMNTMTEIIVFTPIELKKVITVKYLPASTTKPARFSITIDGFPRKEMSRYLTEVDFPYVAQALAEMRLEELGLNWGIKSAGLVSNGVYVFITH